MDEVRQALVKLALPAGAIALLLLVARLRRLPIREVLALRLPSARHFAAWILIWVAWVALTEIVTRKLGFPAPNPWKQHSALAVVLRVAAIGIVGPFAEELIFRGILYWRLAKTRLGEAGTILLLAAAWAGIHYQYSLPVIAFIFADGVVLGLARRQTRSILPPATMHVLGNLFSIYQSLSG